jgi:hypothetical protein
MVVVARLALIVELMLVFDEWDVTAVAEMVVVALEPTSCIGDMSTPVSSNGFFESSLNGFDFDDDSARIRARIY